MSDTRKVTGVRGPKANYGLDAPGVVRNLIIAGGLGLIAWAFGMALHVVIWAQSPEPIRIIFPLQFIGPGVTAACFFLAGWMIYYSYFGKVRMRERVLDDVPWRGDEAVLDVGCGRGLMLIGAAKRLTTGKATGIDLWQEQDLGGNRPEATRRNAELEGVTDRVVIETGDARKLPFADAAFDLVLSNAALHNIYQAEERVSAVRQIARVIKPGGRAILMDIRNLNEYARVLREAGFREVSAPQVPVMSILLMILTFGSLKPGTVVGIK
ncbi:class I SAM-dependent methyltransferase [soil metagenome]